MAISDRISAMYDHVGDIYDTLELGGDTTQNKNIVNINNEIKREYKDFLANGTDTLWNSWNKVNGTGESLTLNNTIKAKMKIDLKGNTSQEGTSTPDSPQDIHVVSGDNTLTIGDGTDSTTYPIYLGVENLFDYTKISRVNNGTNDNGVITSTTNQSAGLKNIAIFYANGSITIPANTTIYFSADIKLNSNSTGGFGTINDNANHTTNVVYPTMSTIYQRYQTTRTYTSATTINAMLIQIKNLVGSVEVSNIMISIGKSISFTPYGTTPIELCKIGDYQDSIYKDNGKWYLEKKIGKIASYNGETITTNYISTTGQLTTGATIYYVLATPTITPITDTTLISQLEAIKLSYDNQTNISQENNDKPFILDVTALGELEI